MQRMAETLKRGFEVQKKEMIPSVTDHFWEGVADCRGDRLTEQPLPFFQSPLALFYLDDFSRDEKAKGFW